MDDVQAMEAMLLAESLNDSGTIDDIFEIDPDTRSIKVPSTELIFGVMTDQEAERKYFSCPKIIGDGVDLTKLTLTINYENANHERDKYIVDDVSVVENRIIFSWLLSEKVLRYSGQVQFAICAVKTDENGVVEIAWNTTLTTGNVLGGLQVDDISGDEESESRDVLAQLLSLMEINANENIQSVKDEGSSQIAAVQAEGATQMAAVEAKGVATLATIPEDYTSMSAQVEHNSRYLAPVIKQTVSGEAIWVDDAAEMPVIGLNVYGKSTQADTPSPDNPQEIVGIDNPTIDVYGKNILNIDSNVSFTKILSLPTYIPAGSYILSFSSETHDGDKQPHFRFYDNKVWVEIVGAESSIEVTLTSPESMIYIYANGTSNANSEGVNATIQNLMLSREGGSYESYKNLSSLSIQYTLSGIKVPGEGNYVDAEGNQWICDEIDFERGVYIKRIGSTTFDGSDDELWEYDTSKLAFRCKISDDILRLNVPDNESRVLNTHYKYDFGVWNDVVTPRGYVVNFDVISIRNLSIDTVTSFRELLSTSPVTVRYILSNPIETPLSDEELLAYKALYSNYGNTVILNASNAGMKVTYATDTKLYIDNKFAELQSTIS